MNRLTNGQRDALVKLLVWTTEEDRRVALSYAHRQLDGVEGALAAVRAGQPTPANFGEILAVARYENAGWMPWMPDGCFEQWWRWGPWAVGAPRGVEQKTVGELVLWLGDVERNMQDGVLREGPLKRLRRLDDAAALDLITRQRALHQQLEDVTEALVTQLGKAHDHGNGHHHVPETCATCATIEKES